MERPQMEPAVSTQQLAEGVLDAARANVTAEAVAARQLEDGARQLAGSAAEITALGGQVQAFAQEEVMRAERQTAAPIRGLLRRLEGLTDERGRPLAWRPPRTPRTPRREAKGATRGPSRSDSARSSLSGDGKG